jgi:microcompartment protein CcmK/EutM
MEIQRVTHELVLSSRLEGLLHFPLKAVENLNGVRSAVVDPIGCKVGEWVFTIANSAARTATGYEECLSDLTIGGIIDNWEPLINAEISADPNEVRV